MYIYTLKSVAEVLEGFRVLLQLTLLLFSSGFNCRTLQAANQHLRLDLSLLSAANSTVAAALLLLLLLDSAAASSTKVLPQKICRDKTTNATLLLS